MLVAVVVGLVIVGTHAAYEGAKKVEHKIVCVFKHCPKPPVVTK
jgi:hypothetical protein